MKIFSANLYRKVSICACILSALGIASLCPVVQAAERTRKTFAACRADDGSTLLQRAAGQETAGRYAEAADTYERAAKAFKAAGNVAKEAESYKKSAAMYERVAAALEGGNAPTPPRQPAPVKVAPPITAAAPAKTEMPADVPLHISPLSPRPGYIIGRAVLQNGSPVPQFTVEVSGFEDGKLAHTNAGGDLTETVDRRFNGAAGRYAVAVPAGAYRASAWATYSYKGRIYNFEMEPLSEPAKFDFKSLNLEKLRGGLVRDFKLSMTGRKKDAVETDEVSYYSAYNGGMLRIDSTQNQYQIGGGAPIPRTLLESYPKDSKIEITLAPVGPMIDGTRGQAVTRQVKLGDDGRWQSTVRAIYPGTYTATARLLTPDGQGVPIHVSLERGKIDLHPGGYDQMVMNWQSSVTVDFLPNDLGPRPCFGVKTVWLYFGK